MVRYAILFMVTVVVVSCASMPTTEVASENNLPGAVYVPRATITAFQPSYSPYSNWSVTVPAFYMDRKPVSNRAFLEFTMANPRWKKSRIAGNLHDGGYLQHWKGDEPIDSDALDQPVHSISYHAALAYCKAQGKILPTLDQYRAAMKYIILGTRSGGKHAGHLCQILYSSCVSFYAHRLDESSMAFYPREQTRCTKTIRSIPVYEEPT